MGTSLLLLCLLLGVVLGPAGVGGQPLLDCPLIGAHLRATPSTVWAGGKAIVKAKVVNARRTPITGLAVRLDLPPGLVAYPKSPTNPVLAPGVNGTTAAYWTGLGLRAGRRGTLKLRIRVCGEAAKGTYRVGGALYLVNATKAVTCLSPIARPAQVCIYVCNGQGGEALFRKHRGASTLTPHTTQQQRQKQIQVKKAKPPIAGAAGPACPTPAPTPAGGDNTTESQGYKEYAPLQRIITGVYVGDVGAGRRLQNVSDDDPRAKKCWTLCSDRGFEPPSYFSVEIGGRGRCFCSQDKCVRWWGVEKCGGGGGD